MSWQKCPVCNGNGTIVIPGTLKGSNPCPTCNGHRIISELTGKPPTYETKTGVPTGTSPCIGYIPSDISGICKMCGIEKWCHAI